MSLGSKTGRDEGAGDRVLDGWREVGKLLGRMVGGAGVEATVAGVEVLGVGMKLPVELGVRAPVDRELEGVRCPGEFEF